MKLSIIIPYYNTEEYMVSLLECLNKQMRDDVEVIIVDDGSTIPFQTDYPWAKVLRQENAGPGIARNTGLDAMCGDYYTFIDSDDLISDNYLNAIITKIDEENFDYCYISWETMPGKWKCRVQLNSVEDKFPGFNLCVWNRVYKTATFGNHRFNPKKLWSEDADFIYRLNERGKKSFISEILYYYRPDTPDSWTKKMFNGDLDYSRIVYNIKEVKPDDKAFLEEVKREYEDNEIVLLTDKLGIPELEHYCMIMPYSTATKGTELRGDNYLGFSKIERPIRTQIVIFTAITGRIGGMETFTYTFSILMKEYYDIIVLYEQMDAAQISRLKKHVRVEKNNPQKKILCDTVIINRITDTVPSNVKFKKKIQMVHACHMVESWSVPTDNDAIVSVSKAAADSYGELPNLHVILNPVLQPSNEKALLLVTATRLSKISAFEKGHERMRQLADELNKANIPFVWLIFGDERFDDLRPGMVPMPCTLNISPYLAMATYYVSLSDAEGFGYSMVEAMIQGVPVISTPINVLPEIGFEENKTGYIVPFDMQDCKVERFRNTPKMNYKYDNDKIVNEWRSLLGNTTPKHDYHPGESVMVRVIQKYRDMELGQIIDAGTELEMTQERALVVQNAGYCRIIE